MGLLRRQFDGTEKLNDRSNFTGHITGGAIVLSPDRKRILLIHHKFLDKWLQPGGHWDPDELDPLTAARREAEEETAVKIAEYLPIDAEQPLIPVHIDSHHIPANPKKDEPEHYHHDFRYVFIADSLDLRLREKEVSNADWFGLDDPQVAELRTAIGRIKSIML